MNKRIKSAASKPTHSWGALRVREFRILWIATLASNAGSWMQKVVTAWLLYQMTSSETWLGIDAIASAIPTVLLLPLGGVIADRVDRRRLLIAANILSACLSLGLAILEAEGALRVTHIILASIINGMVQAVVVPAISSLLPALVGNENLPSAVALQSVQFNLSRIAGPAVGGLILAYLGAMWCFALNALSFLVLVGAFVMIGRLAQNTKITEPLGQSLKEALGLVRRSPRVAGFLALVVATAMLGAPLISMLPAVAKGILNREASTYSTLLSCFGVGAVAASLTVASLGSRLSPRRDTLVALAVLGVCQIQIALGGSTWLASSVIALAGFCFVGTMICLGTGILLAVPDDFRGRISSFQQMCFRFAQPAGALVSGLLATRFGISVALVCFGALLVVTAVVAFFFWRPTAQITESVVVDGDIGHVES